ncbi:hypothetical protein J4230_02460 [Candidatus Woesearchaeota archaeon]|nr:hypothetical protein [Candidatus Woesearchaeota archaeon]
MDKEIKEALNKAREYLLKEQNEEGFWASTMKEPKGPEYLQKPIVITSQVIDALIHLELKNNNSINRAILYCYKERLEEIDIVELLAYQLSALSYSNAVFIKKKTKQLLNMSKLIPSLSHRSRIRSLHSKLWGITAR